MFGIEICSSSEAGWSVVMGLQYEAKWLQVHLGLETENVT